jgi:hypothetical protein
MLWIVIGVVIAALLILFMLPKKRVKVYGSKDCGWTVKQLDYLGSRAEFIDCTKQTCPAWVTGYPGVETPDGKTMVGFTKV